MAWLLALLLTPPSDVEAIRRTHPMPAATARAHLAAARVASATTGEDVDMLLSIAWHESRYDVSAVTREVGGRVSCGAMTPEPVRACSSSTLIDQYRAGAEHLHAWRAATRTERDALLGYAGGYALLRACAKGPVIRRSGRHDDLCRVADVFTARAAWIGRERTRGAS